MPSPEISRVVYPPASPDSSPIVVQRFVPERIDKEAIEALLHLSSAAYGAQFGTRAKLGMALADEKTRERLFANKQATLNTATDNGAQRWVIRHEGANELRTLLDGYVQVVPVDSGLYLSHVMARPPFNRGYGSALLHAALTADHWDPDGMFSLSGFSGSSVNKMYTDLGMLDVGPEGSGFIRFATPPGYGIRGVIAVLEQRRPHLAAAQRIA